MPKFILQSDEHCFAQWSLTPDNQPSDGNTCSIFKAHDFLARSNFCAHLHSEMSHDPH